MSWKIRSSRPEVFCKKVFTGKHLYQNLFFNKASAIKKTMVQLFFCEFCEISKNTFSYRTPLVAASGRGLLEIKPPSNHKKNLKLSSPSEVFSKKGILRNFAKFIGKDLCQSFFFDKIKKRLWQLRWLLLNKFKLL